MQRNKTLSRLSPQKRSKSITPVKEIKGQKKNKKKATQEKSISPRTSLSLKKGKDKEVEPGQDKSPLEKSKAIFEQQQREKKMIQQLFSANSWNLPHKRPDSSNLKDYRKFMKDVKINVNLAYWLLELYSVMTAAGGIVVATSRNFFKEIIKGFCQTNSLPQASPQSYFLLYKSYLLNYQLHRMQNLPSESSLNLGYPTYYNIDSYEKQKQSGNLPRDIFVIEKFDEVCGFDANKLNPKYLRQKYGQSQIEIRRQSPNAFGFTSRSLLTGKSTLLLSEYVDYQQSYVEPANDKKGQRKKASSSDRTISFGVNIDMADKPEILEQFITKLFKFKEFQFAGSEDGLSYLDKQIFGCSLPQIYLKVKGCWTGGHQENTALSALNMNHGPGQSQWFTLEVEHLSRLREQVLKDFGSDIFQDEGLWFQDINWFIKNSYPVKKYLQKKGDLVYLGPGTMHWVRASSSSMHTAWNVMPKTEYQFKISRQRQLINEQIRFNLVIPFKTLTLKILNHEYHINPNAKPMENLLLGWLCEEELALGTYRLHNTNQTVVQMNLPDSSTSCYNCHKEIMLYYINEPHGFYCLDCAFEINLQDRQIQTKYQIARVFDLLHRSRNFRLNKQLLPDPEILGLCVGQFIGEISYCHVTKSNGNTKFVEPKINPEKKSKSSKRKRPLAETMNEQKVKSQTKAQEKQKSPEKKPESLPNSLQVQKPRTPKPKLIIDQPLIIPEKKDRQEKSRSRQIKKLSWSAEKKAKYKKKSPPKQTPVPVPAPIISEQVSVTEQAPAPAPVQIPTPVQEPQAQKPQKINSPQKNRNKVLYPKRSDSSKYLNNARQKTLTNQMSNQHSNMQKELTQQKIAEHRDLVNPLISTIPSSTPAQGVERKNVKYPKKNRGSLQSDKSLD